MNRSNLEVVVDHKSCKKYKNVKASIDDCKRNFRWCIWLLECPTSDSTKHITNQTNNALGPLSIRLSL